MHEPDFYAAIPGEPVGYLPVAGRTFAYKVSPLGPNTPQLPESNFRTLDDVKEYRESNGIPDNIRLTQTQLEEILLEKRHNFEALVEGIKLTGGSHDMPEVATYPGSNLEAKEGARRVGVFRLLRNQGDPNFVKDQPFRIYEPAMTEEFWDEYLMVKHAGDGFEHWTPQQRANALRTWKNKRGMTVKEIAAKVNMEEDRVKVLIEAATLAEAYQKQTHDYGLGKFDVMIRTCKNKPFKAAITATAKHLTIFFDSVKNGKFGDVSRYHISNLTKIFKNDGALAILEHATVEAALSFAESDDTSDLKTATKALDQVLSFLDKCNGDFTKYKADPQWKDFVQKHTLLAKKRLQRQRRSTFAVGQE